MSRTNRTKLPIRLSPGTMALLIALGLGFVLGQLTQSWTRSIKGGTGDLTWEVYYSPRGGATEAIVRELDAAQRSVLVQAYSFTSDVIAKALVDAHKRGVQVAVILDDSQDTEQYSDTDFLHNMGIPTYIDEKHGIAHNKVMVIDGLTVLTGSFNFTKAAEERNAENLLVIRDKKLAGYYEENWRTHQNHSRRYAGRRK
jgi:phosphatidylserine/phosphatidylglycerophosphate/cardiolipin synthase-like enzyme